MKNWRQRLGRRGEALVKRHLEASGYSIVESNYRAKRGEIDLIAEKDGGLVFIEVRARQGSGFGSPEESITPSKRAHLVAAAEEYLQSSGAEEVNWRIEVVALELDSRGRVARLDIIENAVEADYAGRHGATLES